MASHQIEDEGARRPLLGLLVLVALALGLWWRLRGLEVMPLYGDEYHGARITGRPAAAIFFTYDAYGTHVPLPLLQRLCSWLTSPGILAFRMPAVLSGVISLAIFYPLGRKLVGSPAAALATMALAVSPIHIYYSRFGRAYSITVLLGLILLALLARAEARNWRGWGLACSIVLVSALTPWVHLSSAGFIAALSLAAIGLAWARGGARAALRPLVVLALGALLCLVLFLPILEQVVAYITKLPEGSKARPDNLVGIATLLAGSPAAGIIWLLGLPLSVALLWRRRRPAAILLSASIVGPGVFLLASMPHGMEYAYSRYMLNALPAMLLLLAWLLVRCAGTRLGMSLGLVGIVAGHLTGPLSPFLPQEKAFANTYLAMRSLPAFDQPVRFRPAVYDLIAQDEEAQLIIESPILHSRAVLLYRNYYRTHGKDVVMGVVQPEDVRLNGPYAFIGEPQLGRKSGAQYLVVHKNVEAELGAYWTLVYNRFLPKHQSYWNRGLMDRHRTYFVDEGLTEMVAVLSQALSNQLGEPFFEDELVIAWKLKWRPRGERASGKNGDEAPAGAE